MLTPKNPTRITWQDILNALNTLTPEQLQQEALLFPPTVEDIVLLQPIIHFDTAETFCTSGGRLIFETRSGTDFAYHPEQLALMYDFAPYDKFGNTFYECTEEGFVGDKDGQVHNKY